MSIPHQSVPQDRDLHLEEMRQELRAVMASLNELHHPVVPGDPARIAALEAQVAEIQQAIAERRAVLSGDA